MATVGIVFLGALVTALATGLGALPFRFYRLEGKLTQGRANAVAFGLMTAASFLMLNAGFRSADFHTLVGLVTGATLVAVVHGLSHRYLQGHVAVPEVLFGAGLKSILLIAVMTMHSAAEGVAVGVPFGESLKLGGFLTLAVALHNVPEGLAIALVLIPRGYSVGKAALWAIFTSLPQPLLAVPAFLFVETFESFLPFGLGLAAGAMLWVSFSDLIKDASRELGASSLANWSLAGFCLMLAMELWL